MSGKKFMAVVAIYHIAFFLLACLYRQIYMGDSFEYIYEAVNILDRWFFYSGNPALPVQPEYMTQRQPLYPLLLSLVYAFSVNNWIVLVLQNVLSMFNIWYLRRGLTVIGYRGGYDWLLLVLLLAYPIQFIYANTISPEILLQTFTLIYLLQMVRLLQHRRWSHAALASLALIAGLFVKPVLYPFVVVHLALVLLWAFRGRMPLLRALGLGILPLLAVLMYNYWNLQRTGKFHFSSNQAFNAIYYNYFYYSEKEGGRKAKAFLAVEQARLDSIENYAERYDYANARGIALLKSHFVPYTAFHLKHSARYFIEPGKSEIDLFTGKLTLAQLYDVGGKGFKATLKEQGIKALPGYIKNNPSLLVALVVFLFNLLRLAGVVLFLRSRRVLLPVRLLLAGVFCYFALTTGPIANTHYFLPISLMVIGCAVTGFAHWREERKKEVPA